MARNITFMYIFLAYGTIFSMLDVDCAIAEVLYVSIGFNHMTVDDVTGDVYVAGVDYIYRLDKDLQLIYNMSTKPDDGTDNYNKILTINYDDNNLVTCGSDHGYCQIRDLADLSVLGDSGGLYVVAPTMDDSTAGFVAPGYDDKPMLYVGTSRRGLHYGDQAVSGRQLEGNIFRTIEGGPSGRTSIDISASYSGQDHVIYITGFSYDGFSYFLTVQRFDTPGNSYISRIVRVCQDRNDYYYDSYTEVTLECNDPSGTSYNLLQAAHVTRPASDLATSLSLDDGEHVLFAVFAKGETPQSLTPLHQSAVCMYKMTDIEQAFTDAISGCVNQGDDYELDYISRSACLGLGGSIEECSTGGRYRYVNGIDPVSMEAVMEYPNTLLTSIVVTTVQEHTVGFIGTQDGHILNVNFRSNTSAEEYANDILQDSHGVPDDIKLDVKNQHIYVLTEYTVYKLKVEECNQYTTCSECFSSMDPYCGWCILERRCSVYDECTLSNETSRWLDVFSDDMCVNTTSVEPTYIIPTTSRNNAKRSPLMEISLGFFVFIYGILQLF